MTAVTVIFQNGSRETFNNVDDSIARSKSKLAAFLIKRYNNPNIMDTVVDIKRDKDELPAQPTKPNTTVPAGKFSGDKGRWEDLGTGYLHNLDTHEVKLK
jgi:hypothetical protein